MSEQDASPATVFVVEDDCQMRESVEALLQTVGLPVRTFPGPEEFRDWYTASRPGCLLFDVRMPVESGIELYAALLESGCRTPVIFMTAHADVPTAVSAMRTGAIEFLEKPFDRKRLIDLIHRAFTLDAVWREQDSRFHDLDERLQSLSTGERETLELVMAGEPNKVIAGRQGVTERAVEMRRSRLMQKLGVQSTAELLDAAVTHRVLAELRDVRQLER